MLTSTVSGPAQTLLISLMLHLMPRPCNVKVSLQEENQPFHDKVPDRLFVVDQVHKFINRRVLFLFPLVVVVFVFFF